jgi:catechol 2,3-dioxygenase-like lactoylglutathione lyase family enzyme
MEVIQRISAVTLKVADMGVSVQFYRDLLGMELVYGGPSASFSSLRTAQISAPILNLQHGRAQNDWGRIIFHLADVDAFWSYLRENGYNPGKPQDAPWGERFFHVQDPDGHELSFAQPL